MSTLQEVKYLKKAYAAIMVVATLALLVSSVAARPSDPGWAKAGACAEAEAYGPTFAGTWTDTYTYVNACEDCEYAFSGSCSESCAFGDPCDGIV